MKRSLIVVFFALLIPTTSWSLVTTMELGVRGGRDTLAEHEGFSVSEVYYLHTLPWQQELSPTTKVYTRLDAGLGCLYADSNSGGWLAPGLVV